MTGIDIAGDHESIRLAIQHAKLHGGIQCVGKAIFEHPRDARIADAGLDPGDGGVHRFAHEPAFVLGRPQRDFVGFGAKVDDTERS